VNKDKIYAKDLDEAIIAQYEKVKEEPSVVRTALQADAHLGYSMPIGGVALTQGTIFPAWIGYDIGCGVSALKIPYTRKDLTEDNLNNIFNQIYRDIPVGFHHRSKKNILILDKASSELVNKGTSIFRQIYIGDDKKRGGDRQAGTLGGGNHFIELGYDEEDFIWIIVHSGSRGIGHAVASHYMKLASGDGKAREGNFGFKTDSVLGEHYIKDMNACLDFAYANRFILVSEILRIIVEEVNNLGTIDVNYNLINKSHNLAEEIEPGMWLHRKGAASAYKGELCAIPGNMRDGTFIVEGKGNPDSLWSSSHGAGRILGRKQAKRELDVDKFKEEMKDVVAKVGESTLDESPEAYKNIFSVMEAQKDLVEVKHHIKPILNIKG